MVSCSGSESPEDSSEKKPPSIYPSTLEEEESSSLPSTSVPDSSADSDTWSGSEDGRIVSFQSTDSGEDFEIGPSSISDSSAAFSFSEASLPYGSDTVLFATPDASATSVSTPVTASTSEPESPAITAAAAAAAATAAVSEASVSSVVFDAATLAAVEAEASSEAATPPPPPAAEEEVPPPAAAAEPEPVVIEAQEAKPDFTSEPTVTESQPELVTAAAVVVPEVVPEAQPRAELVIKPGSPKPLGPSLVPGSDGSTAAAVNVALYSKNGTAVTLCL